MNIYSPCILVSMLLVSCTVKDDQANRTTLAPKVVAAKGYVVPKYLMAEPKVIRIDESKLTRVPVGDPTIVATNTNIHPAGLPKIVPAGIPRVITLGQGNYPLPKTLPAVHNPVRAGIPEVVLAKDPTIKDPNPQSFSSFGKLQGLKDAAVSCMLEDKQGNLWIGSLLGGAAKYDGKSFTHFTTKEGLRDNHVMSILEDRSGNIWFGTINGVSRYDGKYFTHFTEKEGLSHDAVQTMLEDKSGNLWFGTGEGVSQLSQDRKSFTHLTTKEGLGGHMILSMLEDKSGNIWFGTAGGGVCRLSKDMKSFTQFTEKEGLGNNFVISMLEDNEGNVWFSNPFRGVFRLSRDWKSFVHFTKGEGLINDYVRSMREDKSGNIWFGHLDGGLSRLSRDWKSITHYTEKEGLSNYDIRSILEDKNGNLWFGTYLGVSKYNGKSFTHLTGAEGLSNSSVWSVLEDKSGNLWFGHDSGGVTRLSPDGKSFAHFTYKEGLSGMSVWAILEDKSGSLWLGTVDNGVTQLSPDKKYFTHFTKKDGLCSEGVLSMLEDESGNMWFGTGGGVSRLSLDRKSFTNFTEKEGLINNFVSDIVEDKNGNLWFGTLGGVSRLSRDGKSFTNFTVKEGLSDTTTWAMLEDKSGNLWFGHESGGLSRLSPDEKFFTHYTEKEGLSSNSIGPMGEDKSGNLWFGARLGINKLSKEKLAVISGNAELSAQREGGVLFKNFTYEDGFLGIGCLGTIYADRRGTIWIGANDRLTAYHPEGEVPDTIPPTIQLTSVALFNEDISWPQLEDKKDTSFVLGNGVSLSNFEFERVSNWYFLPENLSLAHNNNYVTFAFVGISQKSPQKVKYQYKLEGNDDDWSAITSRSDATYGNLPPGAYTFKVKAMNSEGYWSEEFNYGFVIRPPWWKTWWAYSLYAFTLLGILFSLRKYEIKRLKLKHRAEHLSELDTLKTRFFANISHEFRTPITLILGPLKELYSKATNDEQKTAMGTMMRNGQRLLRLVNQLLDLSKLESGKMALQASQTDLVQFLREITSSYESLAAEKKIKFFFYPEAMELNLYIDQEKIEKVIHNILSNAFKFTNENGEVILNLKVENNQQAVISVRDTGIGIPDNQLNNVFDRFYQVDNTQTRSYEGSGIGMALAKELVELHHGTISVESKEGRGTTFTVRLPLGKEYLRKEEILPAHPSGAEISEFIKTKVDGQELWAETSATIEDQKTTIPSEQSVLLIVEDNTDMRNYITKVLCDSYQIVEAANGQEGVDKAGEFLPDLIISDIMMPEMDGYKLCELVKTKEITSHIPVILLTAKADQQSRLTGLEQRADDYLLKPFDADELKLIVRNRIEARQKMREKFSREITLEPGQISVSSMDEKFLEKILGLIEAHIEDEDFSIEDFSQEAGYSRMQLYRKLKSLAGQTPSQFVRTIRLKRAAQLLSKKSDNVTQIAYRVGFRSLAYFNKCFKEQFGVTPGQFSEMDISNPKSIE